MSEARFWKVQIRGLNDQPQDHICYVKASTRNKARYAAMKAAREVGYNPYYAATWARISDPPPPGHHFYEAQ